jgi:hypothetical protein
MKGVFIMANFSQHYNLELPTSPEHYDIGVFNKNNMVIDSELNKLDLKNQNQDATIATEITRSTNKENQILETLNNEINRAKGAEATISRELENISENTSITMHTHINGQTLDKMSEDASGNLLFNGQKIGTAGNVTPDNIGAATKNHTHGSMKTITYSATEPASVAAGEIVMVYEE